MPTGISTISGPGHKIFNNILKIQKQEKRMRKSKSNRDTDNSTEA